MAGLGDGLQRGRTCFDAVIWINVTVLTLRSYQPTQLKFLHFR